MTDNAQDARVEEVDWEDSPTISLEDADGKTSRFEMLAILEVDEAAYAVLTPIGTDTDDSDAPLEIQILHYDEHENGTFSLRSVEDDALAAQLFDVVSETLTQAAEE